MPIFYTTNICDFWPQRNLMDGKYGQKFNVIKKQRTYNT